jgi:hypothetical protein
MLKEVVAGKRTRDAVSIWNRMNKKEAKRESYPGLPDKYPSAVLFNYLEKHYRQ